MEISAIIPETVGIDPIACAQGWPVDDRKRLAQKNLQKLPPDVRKRLVENCEKLSLTKQTGLLKISRISIYKRPAKGISDDTIQLMHKIDRIHTDEPTW